MTDLRASVMGLAIGWEVGRQSNWDQEPGIKKLGTMAAVQPLKM